VRRYDGAADGKPEPGAADRALGVSAVELGEQTLWFARRQAWTGVTDRYE